MGAAIPHRIWNKEVLSPWERRKIMHEIAADMGYLGFGCPACRPALLAQFGEAPTVHFYRTSPKSVTMECSVCQLHWTVTWQQLERRLARIWERGQDYDNVSPAWALAKMASISLADPIWLERLNSDQWDRKTAEAQGA